MPGTPTQIAVQPGGTVPINTLPSSNPAGVSDTVGLPFQGINGGVPFRTSTAVVAYDASGVAPVIGGFMGTGQSASFTPINGRNFYVGIDGSFVATIQLERKTPNSSAWRPITSGGIQLYIFTAPACETVEEDQSGAVYRLNCIAYTSGPANYVLEQ